MAHGTAKLCGLLLYEHVSRDTGQAAPHGKAYGIRGLSSKAARARRMQVFSYTVPNEQYVPPPFYRHGEVELIHLSQHSKMTPVPPQKAYIWPHGRPLQPTWMPSAVPPEPWRDPEKTEDMSGLAQPYRDREEVGDGGRLGGEFIYQVAEGSEPGMTKLGVFGNCTLF